MAHGHGSGSGHGHGHGGGRGHGHGSRHHRPGDDERDPWSLVPAGSGRDLGSHVPAAAVPTAAAVAALRPGDLVAVVLEREGRDDEQGRYERLWVELTEVLGDGRFRGELDNQPTFIRGLANGAALELGAGDVYDVISARR